MLKQHRFDPLKCVTRNVRARWCRLVLAWTLRCLTPVVAVGLTLRNCLTGSDSMNLGFVLGGTMNSLLGPSRLEVSPVRNPPQSILVEVASLALVWTSVWTLRVTWAVAWLLRRLARLRQVLLSDSGLTIGAKWVKTVWTRRSIVPQILNCGPMKISFGYSCVVWIEGTVECMLKGCVLQSVVVMILCRSDLLIVIGSLCSVGLLCRLMSVKKVLTLTRMTWWIVVGLGGATVCGGLWCVGG